MKQILKYMDDKLQNPLVHRYFHDELCHFISIKLNDTIHQTILMDYPTELNKKYKYWT